MVGSMRERAAEGAIGGVSGDEFFSSHSSQPVRLGSGWASTPASKNRSPGTPEACMGHPVFDQRKSSAEIGLMPPAEDGYSYCHRATKESFAPGFSTT
jgi:hypothetical protein